MAKITNPKENSNKIVSKLHDELIEYAEKQYKILEREIFALRNRIEKISLILLKTIPLEKIIYENIK